MPAFLADCKGTYGWAIITLTSNGKNMKLIIWLPAVIFFLPLPACQRIRHKAGTARQTLAAQKAAVTDKVIPRFDAYQPDTKFNKARFEEFFGFAPTPDVTGIYCYADRLGIDSKFQFAFSCDTATRARIIRYLALSPVAAPDNTSSGLWQSFPWWAAPK